MFAIYKREIKGYFSSAIGYVVIAVFVFFASLLFGLFNLMGNTSNTFNLFTYLLFIYILLIPILTMRTFSDEKRLKTDQALLTAPVSLFGIVAGKFLAALTVYAIGLSTTVIFGLILGASGTVEAFVIVGNIIGMLLLGSAMIAIGIFVSNLTESQIIAAIASVALLLLLYLDSTLANFIPNTVIQSILNSISLNARFYSFSIGIFSLSDSVFYISVAVIFLFFTSRMLEKRRWS